MFCSDFNINVMADKSGRIKNRIELLTSSY